MSGKVTAAAASGIPAAARKLVQSLKEIVNCPEAEIYATLKECDMDPDATVNRLLTQDTFREVKSKRDKKKETKDTGDSRTRAVNNNSSRGSRISSDRGSRSSYYQSSSNDNQAPRSKATTVKENDSNSHHTSSILGPAAGASNSHQKPSSALNTTTQNPSSLTDGPPLSAHPAPSGFQSAWSGGLHGHLSMADVVKMGRPQAKTSVPAAPVVTDRSYAAQYPAMPSSHASKMGPAVLSETAQSQPQTQPQPQPQPQTSVTQAAVSDPVPLSTSTGTNNNAAHDGSITEDWTIVDQPSVVTTDYSAGVSSLEGEGDVDTQYDQVVTSDVQIEVEESEIHAEFDKTLNNAAVYQSQGHSFDHREDEETQEDAVASAAGNFQQLNLQEEEPLPDNVQEENPAVIIPDHLQVSNADCAHLSFGSFSSGAFSGMFQQKALEVHAEAPSTVEEPSTVDQADNRNEEYYNAGPLQTSAIENAGARMGTRVETLDMPTVSASEPDVLRNEAQDAVHGLQYNMPSVSSHGFPSAAQPSGMEFSYPQGNTQLQNLSAFSSILQANSLHGNLLAPTAQPSRDFDLSLSQLVTSQNMPTKYMASVPSTSGSTISVQEAAKQGVFSNQQPSAQSQNQNQGQTQTLSSTNVPTGPPLPQPLAVHPYSQPTLPLTPFANLIGYPFLPQSYTYLPSTAFQQPYSGNGTFHHQSAPAVQNAGIKYTNLPQYKSSVSSSTSVPQASSVVPGYGAFGGSGSVPGNFAVNPGSGSGASTSLGFDEALSSQYKDMSHYMSLQQQSENPAMWLHGAAGSRTLSTMPASNYYNYQGPTQHGGFRQGQQPSQLNSLGYTNFYHSQIPTGAQDQHHHHHHQQNPGDASLSGGAQGATQQPSHQLWQNNY